MNAIDNSKNRNADISLGMLLETLTHARDFPLVFYYDGRPMKDGYHVTEVKAGQFAALDCGANPESWTEIFVQLWDIEEVGRTHMLSGKFAAILRKVSEHVKLDGSAKLTFEVSDGVRPMLLYQAGYPSLRGRQVHIELAPRLASCKPRDQWLAEQQAPVCCRSSAGKNACCV